MNRLQIYQKEAIMSLKASVASTVAIRKIKQLKKNPRKELPALVKWAHRLDLSGYHAKILDGVASIAGDETNNWNRMIMSILREIDPSFLEKFIVNFAVNAAFVSIGKRQKIMEREGCNIPWAILMDPTAACNLHCTGCWAAEYPKTASMDFDLLDRIIKEGKELGVYMYIYSGGEPLVRKADIMRLAEKHNDCVFLSFTNATLVDEEFAKASARLGNIVLAISIEGFEAETDMRRGQGTYQKVVEAMDILKAKGVPFGFSTCYHKYNTEVVGSEAYIDFMVEKGARFGWYFTYMPLGKDAKTELLATPDQREFMYRRVREFRNTKPIFVLDFWNDGEYVKGCIAGGKDYLHINAAGDVEPCAFIHYSNANIRSMNLLDTLKQPLFREYAAGQPFNDNLLRPCPLLDNPEKLRGMVERSGAHSTQLLDKEDVGSLTAKCEGAAEAWADRAEMLWDEGAGQKEAHGA